jgi:hypothetical protein
MNISEIGPETKGKIMKEIVMDIADSKDWYGPHESSRRYLAEIKQRMQGTSGVSPEPIQIVIENHSKLIRKGNNLSYVRPTAG